MVATNWSQGGFPGNSVWNMPFPQGDHPPNKQRGKKLSYDTSRPPDIFPLLICAEKYFFWVHLWTGWSVSVHNSRVVNYVGPLLTEVPDQKIFLLPIIIQWWKIAIFTLILCIYGHQNILALRIEASVDVGITCMCEGVKDFLARLEKLYLN